MTDLEKLKELFDLFGIEYNEYKEEDKIFIKIEEGNEKVDGYIGFYCEYCFKANEVFENVNIFE